MTKAILFDLGGTLIEYAGIYDSWPLLETPGIEAAYAMLGRDGTPLPSFRLFRATAFAMLPARWENAVRGKRNLRLVDLLVEIATDLQIDRPLALVEQAAAAYQQAICKFAKPIPNGESVLAQLKGTGYRLGLLSNTMFEGNAHQNDLARFNLAGYFYAMLFSADAGMWKPNPDPYYHLLETLEATPEEAIFVGDSPEHDIVGAQNAGIRAVHFPSSQRFGCPEGIQPDGVINGLSELPQLAGQLL